MIKAGAIEKGQCLLMKDQPYLVTERDFVNPGKGSAFVKLKLKNLRTGATLRETLKTADSVETADVFDKDAQFLYEDDAGYHVMDSESYEQYVIPKEGLEQKGRFMREGETYRIKMWEQTAIDIVLPMKMAFVVTEAEDAIKGDTVTGATKTVVIETGISVRVPIFIKEGEKILVNTETAEYVERVND